MYNWIVRRILERTSAPQPVYPAQVDAQVRLWMPAIALLAASFVTPARAKLDVRQYEWRSDPPFEIVTEPAIKTWAPAFSSELSSYSTRDRPRLDVRTYDWAAQPAWIFSALPPAVTTAQIWPAIEAGTQRSYRTAVAARRPVVRLGAAVRLAGAAR